MKKLLMLSAAAFTVGLAAPAMAGMHGDQDKGKMFEQHDTDGNGEISRDEFLTFATQRAEEKFNKLDTDLSGSVSKDEMEAMKKKWKEKRSEHREKMKEKWEERKDDMPPPEAE